MVRRDLPDIYAHALTHALGPVAFRARANIYIRQIPTGHGIS